MGKNERFFLIIHFTIFSFILSFLIFKNIKLKLSNYDEKQFESIFGKIKNAQIITRSNRRNSTKNLVIILENHENQPFEFTRFSKNKISLNYFLSPVNWKNETKIFFKKNALLNCCETISPTGLTINNLPIFTTLEYFENTKVDSAEYAFLQSIFLILSLFVIYRLSLKL